jgi:tRNA A22 N-methylase
MVPPGEVVVDVGCDHGKIAAALGAIGTEREPHRLPERRDFPLVVANGLRPFRSVDVAIITGMGHPTILEILSSGPRPRAAIVHTPQHADRLRQGLADRGWRIEAERLAPEGGRFAEIIRVVPGKEPHRGHPLWFGPLLAQDPLLEPHRQERLLHFQRLRNSTPENSPRRQEAEGWIHFLQTRGTAGL